MTNVGNGHRPVPEYPTMVLLPTMKASFACFASATVNLRWLTVLIKLSMSSSPLASACTSHRAPKFA